MKNVTYVVGCYWGDCGKGRSAFYASKNADVVVRATGGNNAGHTVVSNGVKYPLHLLPSGIINEEKICVIGPAVLIDPSVLTNEMERVSKAVSVTPERLKISGGAHMIMPYHKQLDILHEEAKGASKVGTTGRGIGPAEADKRNRIGIRLYDLFLPRKELEAKLWVPLKLHNMQFRGFGMKSFEVKKMADFCQEYAEKLKPFICNTDLAIAEYTQDGKEILIEGAQSFLLDIEHGMYPMVTSTSPNGSGTMSGAGIGPIYAKKGIGVLKSYCSKVGNGPFPTEENNEVGDIIREFGHEYGTTTGRPRRCGWLDFPILRSAKVIMGLSELCVNHLDTLGMIGNKLGYIKMCMDYTYQGKTITRIPDDIEVTHEIPKPNYIEWKGGWDTTGCKTYEDLPEKAKRFIELIEFEIGLPVTYIGIGADNKDTIVR